MNALLFLAAFLFSLVSSADTYPILRVATPFSGSTLYKPNDALKHTSIVMLHGSEGGSAGRIASEANILAMQGYEVLTYCYFDCNRVITGPRETLKHVEVTKILDAVAWLRALPSGNGKVAVYGFSRGAELTLMIGSLAFTPANRPDALIAHTPSDVANGAYNWDWVEPACWLCRQGLGKCDDQSPNSAYQWNPACGPDDLTLLPKNESAWLVNGVSIPAGERTQIERYTGPILITVGTADEIWPYDQTKRIEATLRKANANVDVHYFPGAGHGFHDQDEIDRRLLVLNLLKSL